MEASHSYTYRAFARCARFSYNYAPWILFAAFLIAIASTVYVVRNLGMNTDTTDILSEDLPFRVNSIHYNKTFPQEMDILLLVLDAPTPEQAYSAAGQLAARLKKDPKNFIDVYAPNVDVFFERNGLLYENISELGRITDRLAEAQPLIARIADSPSLHTFTSVLTGAIKELSKGRNLELGPVLKSMSDTLDARLAGKPQQLSWQTLFRGEPQKNSYQEIILVKPRPDYSQLFASEQAISAVHAAAREIGLTEDGPIQLRVTGDMALANDELKSSLSGMEYAGIITFVLVAIVLYFAMRSIGMVLAVLLCLTLGLLLTAAFATAAIGQLNVISIAFAVLYIGLGADFAIHFLLRYREVLENGQISTEAMYKAGGEAGSALAACTIANAIGFYAFIPTSYSGVAELGIISGTGMLISLLVTFIIGPALLRYLSKRPISETSNRGSLGKVLEFSLNWRKLTYAVILVLLLIAIALLPQIRFDYNLLNMQDPKGKAVQTFRELLALPEHSPWYAIVLTKDREEARQLKERLAELPEVGKIITFLDFVPTEQEEKLSVIEEMALIIGPLILSLSEPSTDKQMVMQQLEELNALSTALGHYIKEHPESSLSDSARTLKTSLAKLFSLLDSMDLSDKKKLLHSIEEDLLYTLPIAIQRLRTSVEATPFSEQDLPEPLSRRWLSHTGEYRIAVYPSEDIGDNKALARFVRAVQQIAPHATGMPVVSLEAGEAVVEAFIQAFSLALIGITVALLILLRSIKYTLLVLIPLLLSSVFTGVFTVLLNIPFNFANIIALPLLLGLGIDSSLHMVHRSIDNHQESEILIHTSTARAIFYSALTALVDFASLMFSPHKGTASMGALLTVGLAFTLICTLIILPALLRMPAQYAKS
ncbi:MMPL family transporter [Nitrosomonas communis]|uniref:MMPL family transporter n=1 Tax=Nitrosomonas communis TaxID=44574 RepID=UPI003D2C706E